MPPTSPPARTLRKPPQRTERTKSPASQSAETESSATSSDAPSKDSSETNSDNATGPSAESNAPWSPASSLTDNQGLNLALFSDPGVGKTTLLSTITESELGGPLLIVNFDEEVRSISDRDDVMVWPGEKQNGSVGSWLKAAAFLDSLLRRKHPFKSIGFDTLNSAYHQFILPPIQEEMGERADGRQVYGKANDELLRFIRLFSAQTRSRGINIVYCIHAEKKVVGDEKSSVTYIRPEVTPGVNKGLYQMVSTIGYLEAGRMNGPRKLILAPSPRIIAKHHQPRSGWRLPNEIPDPNLGKLLDHVRGVRQYPLPKKKDE